MNKTIIIILLLLQSTINAQIDSLRIQGEIGVRGIWQTGNFAQFVINPNGRITFEKKRTHIEIQANYEFLKVNKESLINDFWSFGLYQYNSGKTIFPIAMVHYGFAQAYAIDRSLIGGSGAGINLIQKNEHSCLQANIFAGYLNLKYENAAIHKATSIGFLFEIKISDKERFILLYS